MRAAAGEAKMRADICDVCEVIFKSGQRSEDGCAAIQFGELFEVGVAKEEFIFRLLESCFNQALINKLYEGLIKLN